MAVEKFLADELTQHGIMGLIQTHGETARRVSPEFRQAHPEIPWLGIEGDIRRDEVTGGALMILTAAGVPGRVSGPPDRVYENMGPPFWENRSGRR